MSVNGSTKISFAGRDTASQTDRQIWPLYAGHNKLQLTKCLFKWLVAGVEDLMNNNSCETAQIATNCTMTVGK